MAGVQMGVSVKDNVSSVLKTISANAQKIYGDFDKANSIINKFGNTKLDGLEGSSSTASKALKALNGEVDGAGKSVESLASSSTLATKAVQGLGTVVTATGKGMEVLSKGMKTAGTAMSTVGTGVEGIGKAVKGVGSGITSFGGMVDNVGSSLTKLGGIGTGVITALGGIGTAAANTALDFIKLYESSNIVFEKMLGGSDAANALYTDLLNIAKASTFSQETFLSAGKSLIGVGVSAENTKTYLQAITDAVAGFGGSSAQIEQIAGAFRKVATNGRISMLEVNQLADAGVNVMTILANSYGKTTEEMRDMISYHPELLGGADVLNVLAEGIENGTEGAAGMTQAMKGMAATLKGTSLTGQFDSLHSSIRSFSLALMGMNPTLKEGDEGYEESEKRIRQLTAALGKINEIIPKTAKLFSGVTDGIGKFLDKMIGSDPVFNEATGQWENAGGVLTGLAEKIKAMPEVKIPGLKEIPGQLEAIIPGFDRIEEKIKSLGLTDKITKGIEKLHSLLDKTGEKLNGLAEKLKKSDNPFIALLGSGLSGAVGMIEKVSGMLNNLSTDGNPLAGIGEWFKNLDPEQLSTLTGIVFKLVSLSPMLLVFGKGISLISKPIKMVGGLVSGFGSGILSAGKLIKTAGGMVSKAGDAFGGLADKLKGTGKALKDFEMPSIGSQVLKASGLTNLKDVVSKNAKSAGDSLTEAFRPGVEGVKSMFDGLKYSIKSKLAGIGKEAIPLAGPTEAKTGLMQSIGYTAKSRMASIGAGEAIALSGPVESGGITAGLNSTITGLSSAIPGLLSGIGQIGVAFIAACPAIAAVAAAIGGVTIALGLLNKDGGGAETVSNLFNGIAEKIQGFKDIAVQKITDLSNWIVEQGPALGQRGLELIEAFIGGLLTAGGSLIDAGVNILGSLAMGLLNAAPTLVSTGLDVVAGLITWLQEKTPEWLMIGLDWLINLGKGLADNLPVIIGKAAEIVSSLLNGLAEHLPEIIEGGINMLVTLGQGILERLPYILEVAMQIIGSLVTGLIDNLPTILNAGWNLLTSLCGAILGGLGELAKAAVTLIGTFASTLWDNKWQILEKMGQILIDIGKSVANAALTIGDNLIKGIWNGIVGAWNWLVKKWDNLIGGLSSAVSWLFPDTNGKAVAGMAGYASGTESARRGVAIVGEEGPELVKFNGGETVYNNYETKSLLKAAQPREFEPIQTGEANISYGSGEIKIEMNGWTVTGTEELQQDLDKVLDQFVVKFKSTMGALGRKPHAVTG